MLFPAITWKDQIEKEFAKRLYTEDMFYYQGYAHGHELSEIKPRDNVYQWAIVGNHYENVVHESKTKPCQFWYERRKRENKLVGYFSYCIDQSTDTVDRFGLISFDKDNPLVGHDVFKKMNELILNHHRVEWRCVVGNSAMNGYRKFINRITNKYPKLQSQIVMLHDVTKDTNGKYCGEFICEIINPEK